MEKGRDLPQWYFEEPDLFPGDDFYLRAFNHLSTGRSYGMSIGPIPWWTIVMYADRSQLEPEVAEAFINIILGMDNTFLDWHAKEEEARKEKR